MNRIGNKTVETLVVTRSNNSSNKQSLPEEISVYKQTNLKMQALVLCLSVSFSLRVREHSPTTKLVQNGTNDESYCSVS
jgi:hypothetical protein